MLHFYRDEFANFIVSPRINVLHFLIQRIFKKTSLQILSDCDGVMRFGTKIFTFTAYVYSQILRLHANCAYAFSNVKENHPQNTLEKSWYISLTLQISQFLFPLVTFSAHEGSYHVLAPYIILFTNCLFYLFNEIHTHTHTLKNAHTHACPRSYQF